ncbi:MAG: hypothetical protein WB439_06005 [Acidobacteriaceae bacterium]
MNRGWMRAGTLLGILLACGPAMAGAQTCTTQAGMTSVLRDELSSEAMNLAQRVKEGAAAKVQADTIAEFASGTSFAPTESLVQSTSARVASDELRVTQIYELDASSRQAGDTSEADFSCPLLGTTAEVDFAIPGLPRGLYGFAMVEATGSHPWLLAFLLRRDGGVWKLAGFYPRARAVGGHDGLWYWKSARTYSKADELWLAWVFYGEADELLRPANFVTSTDLELLRTERRAAAPPELLNGIGPSNPLVVKATGQAGGVAEYRFTSIAAEASEDGQRLNLALHVEGNPSSDSTAAAAQSKAAAQALLDAHIELRQAFHNVLVFMDVAGREPLVTEETISSIP